MASTAMDGEGEEDSRSVARSASASNSLGLPLTLGIATALLHLLTAVDGWDLFRDELYYVANGRRPGLGYVDHPPLIGWLTWLVLSTLGESKLALRALPALAGGATVLFTCLTARRLGGGRWAVLLAGTAAAAAPAYLAAAGYLSMNAVDLLIWAVAFWLLADLLEGRPEPRGWLILGLVLGIGLLNKLSVLFLGFGLAVGVVATRRWDLLRARWTWLGALLAVGVFLPHVVWQGVNGWPTLEFMANATRLKNLPLSPSSFLAAQAEGMGFFAVPLFAAGLYFLLVSPRGRRHRVLGWAVVAILVLMITQRAKPYYFSPAFSGVFAAGGVLLERWGVRLAAGRWLGAAYLVLLLTGGAVALPLVKPLLAVEPTVAYLRRLGIEASTAERKEVGRLPQFLADRLGWRELAETVARVHQGLPAAERPAACVFAENYGQAGAVEHYGRELDVPPVLAGHNSYFLWGPGDCTGELLIVIGGDRDDLTTLFTSVEHGASYRCQDCMPYEAEKEIWIVRGLRAPLVEAWPGVKNFS